MEFEAVAKKAIVDGAEHVGVWTDGVSLLSDNSPPCAYRMHEGKTYKVTIELAEADEE